MKFTIDIEEFWAEDDENLSEALQNNVKYSVINTILSKIQDQVDRQITDKALEIIDSRLEEIIDTRIAEVVDTETIRRYGEEIPIVDHIKKIFQDNTGWNNADAKIARVAKEFGEELKLQYNNAFANKIVQNMKEQGLLKDEVVSILLEDKGSK